MRNWICLLAVVCLFAGKADGRDIYVNNTSGNDASTGSQPRNLSDTMGPVRTIAKALRLAMPGDHVILGDTGRPYRESISLVGSRHSGMPVAPLVFDGNGATLDGSADIPKDRWTHYRDNVFCFRPPQMGAQKVFLDGRPVEGVPLHTGATVVPKLDPRQWCALDGVIYFAVEPDKMPSDYKLSYACLPTGITLYHVGYVVIKDLTIERFKFDGIAAQNSARRVELDTVTCRDNGQYGIAVGGASQVEIESCKSSGNGVAQLVTMPGSELHVYNSDLKGDLAPGWMDQGARVYLGSRRVQGGMKVVRREDAVRQRETAKTQGGGTEKGKGGGDTLGEDQL